MASTPIPINLEVSNAATTLYTAYVGGTTTSAQLVSLDLQNKTTSEITVDVWILVGATLTLLADDMPIRPRGHASWRGLVALADNDVLRAQSSVANSVDALGTVVETV
jgi:hypothetical protein